MIFRGKKINFSISLSAFLEKKGINQREFCEITGFDASQVNRWIKGVNEPYPKTIVKINEMYGDFIDNLINDFDNEGQQDNKINYKEVNSLPKTTKLNLMIVPLKAYGGFLNGYANRVFLDSLEYAHFPFIKGQCFAFEIEGFSMMPDIMPGDYVVCTEIPDTNWLNKGKIYVFQTIEGLCIKVFEEIKDEKVYLKSINNEYNPVTPIPVKSVKKIYYKEYIIKK